MAVRCDDQVVEQWHTDQLRQAAERERHRPIDAGRIRFAAPMVAGDDHRRGVGVQRRLLTHLKRVPVAVVPMQESHRASGKYLLTILRLPA